MIRVSSVTVYTCEKWLDWNNWIWIWRLTRHLNMHIQYRNLHKFRKLSKVEVRKQEHRLVMTSLHGIVQPWPSRGRRAPPRRCPSSLHCRLRWGRPMSPSSTFSAGISRHRSQTMPPCILGPWRRSNYDGRPGGLWIAIGQSVRTL